MFWSWLYICVYIYIYTLEKLRPSVTSSCRSHFLWTPTQQNHSQSVNNEVHVDVISPDVFCLVQKWAFIRNHTVSFLYQYHTYTKNTLFLFSSCCSLVCLPCSVFHRANTTIDLCEEVNEYFCWKSKMCVSYNL